jgi:ketosteroid isomerase-like protein
MKRAPRAPSLLPLALLIFINATAGLSQDGGGDKSAPSPHEVAEAERAFARRSVETGWREAFLEFFADDAVSYAPDPGNAKERLRKRPPTPQPQRVILNWWPVYADVSHSGDMGLSTGPSVGYENTPERKVVYNGYYFSVWKRQPDGAWKVAIDVGVRTPAPPAADAESAPLRTAPPPAARATGMVIEPALVVFSLLGEERAASRRLAAGGDLGKAYGRLVGEGARLHREGVLPLVGKDAITAHLSEKARRLKWRPAAGKVSRAGDFAYTYGSYELTARDAAVERGYYLHVWRRDAPGRWRLTADVMHPAPPEKK